MKEGILSTPAVSAVIRKRKANGGFIMSASHNPGGPEYDWGIKFNYSSGQPAPESITDKIYGNTLSVSIWFYMNSFDHLCIASVTYLTICLLLGLLSLETLQVEVIDPVSDYLELMEDVFDFQLIKSLVSRSDYRFIFDAMHAVTGAYAQPIFVDKLGARLDSILNGVPLEDFGHGHPDPNLTYAKDLVNIMYGDNGPDFGAASDGDGDRNMILGKGFFITPSDSVAIIASQCTKGNSIFPKWPKGSRSGISVKKVAESLLLFKNDKFSENPNYSSSHWLEVLRESYGCREIIDLWRGEFWNRAVLAWLSIIAYQNKDKKSGEKLVSVADVAKEHWAIYGRNFFSRYDYE
ncbi:hypothetical protein F8388_022331, partial [Cannabis sativa]